jgi:branched-chain amino acid transport system ATP-binding protein
MIKIENLSSFYGKVEVIKSISLEVNEGEVVTIIGANGAGKTSTLRTISGLMRCTGTIQFMGHRIDHLRPDQIVKMGIAHVPENGGIFPQMTVFENLELGACIRKDRQKIRKDLQTVHEMFPILRDRKAQMAGTLSGGERQMLAIGRGLMTDPQLFLLDEPSNGLSPLMVKELGTIIGAISKMGKTVLLVEQNALMALKVSHRAYVLEVGRITMHGQASEIMNDDHVKAAYLGK